MARKMTEWPSKRGPISKIRPSDGCGRDAVLLAVERWYDFPEFGGYLGNFGLSLPRLLGTTVENIPASVPYLHVKNDVEPENPTISSNTRRIGIAWAGDPTHGNDKNRSCDLRTFLPLMSLPKTRFYSLQVGDRSVDIETHGWCPLLSPGIRNFAGTARLVSRLDLVICVDTAVAHLAGALGKPVWVLLPYAPDWR